MSRFTYVISTVLALCGTTTAVCGVVAEQWKAFLVGLVFLLGALIFAVLHIGTRRKPAAAEHRSAERSSADVLGD